MFYLKLLVSQDCHLRFCCSEMIFMMAPLRIVNVLLASLNTKRNHFYCFRDTFSFDLLAALFTNGHWVGSPSSLEGLSTRKFV